MADDVLLVISTFSDAETARSVAEQVVKGNFAACANILPGVESVFRWEGKLENAREVMVFFKTTKSRYPEFEAKLRALHPYDVPEIVCFQTADGLPEYLQWVGQNCSP